MDQVYQNLVKNFFRNLSNRFSSENDLSDITWALCQALPEFKKTFLTFFFARDFKDCTQDEVAKIFLQREYGRSDSRPDFYFEHMGKEYIIEVKKEDIKDHFEQYRKSFPAARFGWIANYTILAKNGVEVHTWEEFSKTLERIETTEVGANALIESYNVYLRNICGIIKINRMKFDSTPLFLMKVVRNIIEEQRQEYVTSIYRNLQEAADYLACDKRVVEMRLGEYFSLERTGSSQKKIYPWFGIYFNEDGPSILLEFKGHQGWCKWVYEEIEASKNLNDGRYFYAPEFYDDFGPAVGFQLKKEELDKINDNDNVEYQREILKKYFEEVIGSILQYI